jgi:phosphoserine phosphatase RsbU/P
MRIGSIFGWLAALAFCVPAAVLPAQSFDLDRGRQAVVSLDGFWRFHPGDSPKDSATGAFLWAQPGFDDSGWKLLRSDESWSDQGYPGMGGYAWYRFTIEIPPGSKPTSLLLAPIVSGFELFVGGRFDGSSSDMPPIMVPNTRFSYRLFPLAQAGSGAARTVHVAIRVWHSPVWSSYMGGGPYPIEGGSLAGDSALLAVKQHHLQVSRNVLFVDTYAYSIASAIVGVVILCLFLMRTGEREYLWFGVMMLADAAESALVILKEIYAIPPVPIFDFSDAFLDALVVLCMFLFLARVLRARLRPVRRLILALLIFSPLPAIFYWPGWLSAPASAALQLVCMLPAMLWIFYLLILRATRGNKDAWLLLGPVFLSTGYWTIDNLVILLDQAGLVHRPDWMIYPLSLPPFTIHIQILLNLLFLMAMLLFLIRRFSHARKREERMAGEFEAARQVQHVLMPEALEPCPGFDVHCIYSPAEQVGGDFFQQIPDAHGGMLIVVGDVSGKGLPAAMMVSVLVGAIRAEAARGTDAAALVNSLNQRMAGRARGGFTTCLAAHISAEGALTVANAGHLPPYLNGNELEIPGTLPLGILDNTRYKSVTLQLAPADRLTFISDGVVEAQTRAGELFGFDRTRRVSTAPAERIAEAARAFGQIDDITVVTVEFFGAPVTAPARTGEQVQISSSGSVSLRS